MELSLDKCFLLCQGPGPTPHLEIGGFPLSIVDHNGHRDLGLLVTPSGDFARHTAAVVAKARAKISFVFRALRSRDSDILVYAYKTYVRCILESASVVFGSISKGCMGELEMVQRVFTHRVYRRCALPDVHYSDRAKFLGLPSITSRFLVNDLCFVHAVHAGRLFCPAVKTGTADDRYPLSRPHRLAPDRRSSPYRTHFLPNRIAPAWNALSAKVVSLKAPAFRAECDRTLSSFRYD